MASAPHRLRTELVINPKGVTVPRPRLSWWVDDARPAELQSAYHIIAATSEAKLDEDTSDLWDSGVVDSRDTVHIPYGGDELSRGQRVWWKVRTFDSDGLSSSWSDAAYFEMSPILDVGLKGRWIAAPLHGSKSRSVVVPILRREFEVPTDFGAARLVVAALGDYRVEINGRRLVESPCSPVWADYRHETYYQTCDVSGLLQEGANAIAILLGDGAYCGRIPDAGRGAFGDRPAIQAQIFVRTGTSPEAVLATDHAWHWHPSWIVGSEFSAGDHVDGRQRIEDWSRTGLDELRWSTVDVCEEGEIDVALRSQVFPLDSVQQVLRPQNIPLHRRLGRRMRLEYDFGAQIVGRCRIDLLCAMSDAVELEYSLDDSFAEVTRDTYTTGLAPGNETFETEFALHSFRFLAITFTEAATEVEDIYALRIALTENSNLAFRCDHPSINQLFEVAQNSLRAVAQYAPWKSLESSQRRPSAAHLGCWLEVLLLQGNYALVRKWLLDLERDLARPGPRLESVLFDRRSELVELAQFETLVRGAWAYYRYVDDKTLLEDCYGSLRATAMTFRRATESRLQGDVDEEVFGTDMSALVVGTANFHSVVRVMTRIAGVLAQLGDLEMFEQLAIEIRAAFRRRFLTQDGYLGVDSQSAYVAALHYGMLEPDERPLAQDRLVELIQTDNYHSDVVPGLVHALLPTLTNADRLDVAYMLLLQTSAPSWLHNVNTGLQLIARKPSQFDVAETGVLQWILESMIGIRLDEDYSSENNGFRKVNICPQPPLGHLFAAGSPIQFVEMSLVTISGKYEISWHVKEESFEMTLVVPPNCLATVTLPDGIEEEVRSGKHNFVMGFDMGGDGVPTLLEMTERSA